ncbi:3-dehydroquinate synthase [Bdellovibrionota bacterium FG-2]
MKPLIVRVPFAKKAAHSCDIRIGSGATQLLGQWLSQCRSKRAFIISDARLTNARSKVRKALASAGWETHEIPVTAGEAFKDIEAIYPLYGKLLNAKADRNATLFAVGGGSVGDAAGFVASTYLRGIDWVGIPTTLLAQVDSAVGGKTGINHRTGKNLIGTFHQPKLVICDTDFLSTLSTREIVSGLGEIIKYGITFDPKFFAFLERNNEELLARDSRFLTKSIRTSLIWKAKKVAFDEFDRKGVREALNFGHTFGHALESFTKYETFQHGEAVIWGMRFALALSVVRGKLDAKTCDKIDSFLATFAVPPLPAKLGAKELSALMAIDKKVRDGKIHFVLLKALGRTESDNGVTNQDITKALSLLRASS